MNGAEGKLIGPNWIIGISPFHFVREVHVFQPMKKYTNMPIRTMEGSSIRMATRLSRLIGWRLARAGITIASGPSLAVGRVGACGVTMLLIELSLLLY